MISFNPSFGANPLKAQNVKQFVRNANYKNGLDSLEIKMESMAPRSYKLDIFSKNAKGEPVSAYGESFGNGTLEEFKEWAQLAMDKVKKVCSDENVVKDMQAFFESIAK